MVLYFFLNAPASVKAVTENLGGYAGLLASHSVSRKTTEIGAKRKCTGKPGFPVEP